MNNSLGSLVLQEIETSMLQAVSCHFCRSQNIKAEAYIILSKAHKKARTLDKVRVMCENGHIFAAYPLDLYHVRINK